MEGVKEGLILGWDREDMVMVFRVVMFNNVKEHFMLGGANVCKTIHKVSSDHIEKIYLYVVSSIIFF